MGSFSLMHWMIVLLVIMLLFGGGRISGMMGDVAKGIKSFKRGLEDDDDDPVKAKPAAKIEAQPVVTPTPVSATPVSATEDSKQV